MTILYTYFCIYHTDNHYLARGSIKFVLHLYNRETLFKSIDAIYLTYYQPAVSTTKMDGFVSGIIYQNLSRLFLKSAMRSLFLSRAVGRKLRFDIWNLIVCGI